MQASLIFERASDKVLLLEHRSLMCFNGLHTLKPYITGEHVYYDAMGNTLSMHFEDRHMEEFKLIGLGWWKYAGEDDKEIPGGRADHISCKTRPLIKEKKILKVIEWEKAKDEPFGRAIRASLGNWAFVSSDWPISVAVSYLQGYRNVSNFISRTPTAHDIFRRAIGYSRRKTWIPTWDLVCNDGQDSSILSYAGDTAIQKVDRSGYLACKTMYKNGTEKMGETGFYRKGEQSFTVTRSVGESWDTCSQNLVTEAQKHKNFWVRINSMTSALSYTPASVLVQNLAQYTPTTTLNEFIQRV